MTRNRHERHGDSHQGTLPATLVQLAESLGAYPTGTSVEDVLRSLYDQIVALESGTLRGSLFVAQAILFKQHLSSFPVNAWMTQPRWLIDAIMRSLNSSSFLIDSWLSNTHTFNLNSIIKAQLYGTGTLDAELASAIAVVYGSAIANAVLKKTMTPASNPTVNAVLLKNQSGSKTMDSAMISSADSNNARVSQLAVEALTAESNAPTRVSQIAIEVLRVK